MRQSKRDRELQKMYDEAIWLQIYAFAVTFRLTCRSCGETLDVPKSDLAVLVPGEPLHGWTAVDDGVSGNGAMCPRHGVER